MTEQQQKETMDNKKKKRKRANYINKHDFYDEIVKSQEQNQVTEELGKMFMMLAKRNLNRPEFVRYPDIFKEDLQSVAVTACIMNLNTFNPNKTKEAFSYFTSVVYTHSLQYCKKEYTQKNVKNKAMLLEGHGADFGFTETFGGDSYEGGFDSDE